MMAKRILSLIFCLVASALVAGCGRGGIEPEVGLGPDGRIAGSVQQTVEAIAVAQTVVALTAGQPSATAEQVTPATGPAVDTGPTTAALPPTANPAAPTPVETAAVPDIAAGSCTVLTGVNLRPGPGTAYNPPLGALGAGTLLAPLAFAPLGNPSGQWLQVRLDATGQVGWVSAGSQYVSCDVGFSDLPLAVAPPPTVNPPTATTAIQPTAVPPTATTAVQPTATRVQARFPDIDNDVAGGSFPEELFFCEVVSDPTFLFRMDVHDLSAGSQNGDGIVEVFFNISGTSDSGQFIDYSHDEQTPGYCVFGGGEPDCHTWPVDDEGNVLWPDDLTPVESGDYFASLTVISEKEYPDIGNTWNWNFNFRLDVP